MFKVCVPGSGPFHVSDSKEEKPVLDQLPAIMAKGEVKGDLIKRYKCVQEEEGDLLSNVSPTSSGG